MPKLYDLQEITKVTGLPERTLRYYLTKVVDAPSGTPGRKSYYDQATVDRLMLAQQVLAREYDPKKGEVKPTLAEFRAWVESLSDAQLRELAETPYRIKPKLITQAAHTREPAPRMMMSESRSVPCLDSDNLFDEINYSHNPRVTPNPRTTNQEDSPPKHDSASQYLDRVMGTPMPRPPKNQPAAGQWQTHRFGPDLEIRTRQPLDRDQRRQLKLAGELLRTALKKGPRS